ncbi:MAG: MauE/DoxX family redox-associated membrane protein [Pseudooceanicola sp.]
MADLHRSVEPRVQQKAVLYRMALPDHLCPYGQKSRWLLESHGYEVEDHLLETREEVDAFMDKHNVQTTPQTFIGSERIGGYEALRGYFGQEEKLERGSGYGPVLTLFAVAALIAVAMATRLEGDFLSFQLLQLFVATAMCLLGLQKLKDIESFSTMFLNYDLLAQKYVPYGYLYPFLETGAGVLMIAGVLGYVSAPVALFIGSIGAWSVFRAVYIEKRELNCACMGGDSDTPLGALSLTENLMMAGMGAAMLVRLAL